MHDASNIKVARRPSVSSSAHSAVEAVADTARCQIITMGCRLNAYESEVMRRHINDAGLENVVVVNTCAVTNEAVRQARQTIRRLNRDNPEARVIVTGCAAQIEPERFAALEGVDHVIGNAEKMLGATFAALAKRDSPKIIVNDIQAVTETAGHMINGFGNRARAYVQVQNGCDHRCTFCIIPYGRGPSRSVPAGDVVSEIRRLVDNGFGEIVLTGVDMTSYGSDLPGDMRLGRLVRQILKHIPELPRLRLSSIDQVEADPDLMAALAEEERLMPHLHLSMQAGDDMILKRMKRRHSRSDAIRFCAEVRRLRPDIVFGADLIAGFPTETEAMFAATCDLVEACGLTHLHVFPFSPRQGTPAAKMPQNDRQIVKSRAAHLRDLGERALETYLGNQENKTVSLLMERPDVGRTPQYAEVRLVVPVQGTFARARITGHTATHLIGEATA
ncbi:MAG: tRNA (N(6)-L-threonylcarbamoyladenosine(37)-C(2))-methylthiotransferase MtaB [Hyphomicrobiaceae bacterium]|nr:tRNA (N(6)-L-threonylcarbamoyladenosine(37)-C(2))-methylthiotransferase MtaB [Hyphomicrobiaceae bacterium]MCC0009454.1 tRNA (N(6)-L-threonylcarbamoyladenosine(37)-C(2))-methylthiotransferase MtaB [Hyphomicrobiaceae bacterium]